MQLVGGSMPFFKTYTVVAGSDLDLNLSRSVGRYMCRETKHG